jgi:hypothetical protein
MVKAMAGTKFDYEKVVIDEWVEGVISDVQERLNENRKFKNEQTGEWETKAVQECRFVFTLDGCKYNHYSRWMTISVAEKSNLWSKYLKKLCPELAPNISVDLDALKGVKVKTMWTEEEGKDGNIYQVILQIKAVDKIIPEMLIISGSDDLPF